MVAKVYKAVETAVTFLDTGGTVTFMGADVADAAGRISAQHDFGASSSARRFTMKVVTKFVTAAPTAGKVVKVYVVPADGTGAENVSGEEPGTSDAALSAAASFDNFHFVGAVVVESTSLTKQTVAFFDLELPMRYVSVALWNATGGTLDANDGSPSTYIHLIPVPDEIQ